LIERNIRLGQCIQLFAEIEIKQLRKKEVYCWMHQLLVLLLFGPLRFENKKEKKPEIIFSFSEVIKGVIMRKVFLYPTFE